MQLKITRRSIIWGVTLGLLIVALYTAAMLLVKFGVIDYWNKPVVHGDDSVIVIEPGDVLSATRTK